MTGDGWKWCPHKFGWSVAKPSRKTRFCRVCAKRQRLIDGVWR